MNRHNTSLRKPCLRICGPVALFLLPLGLLPILAQQIPQHALEVTPPSQDEGAEGKEASLSGDLQVHQATPAKLQVIELAGAQQISAGDSLPVRFRLRALSPVRRDIQVRVGLSLAGTNACEVTTNVSVPAAGVGSGDLLPLTRVELRTPPYLRAGEYRLAVRSDGAVIDTPDALRLPTSVVEVTRPSADRVSVSLSTESGIPAIRVNGQRLRTSMAVTDASDNNAIEAVRRQGPDLVRTGAAIGRPAPGYADVPWLPDGSLDFSELDDAVSRILSAAPQTTLLLDLRVSVPDWWLDAHRSELVMVTSDDEGYTRLQHASYSSETWRDAIGGALRATAEHLEQGPIADCIAGYQISAGRNGRWIAWLQHEGALGDYSPAAAAAFRSWLQDKYDALANLRTAWGQPVRPATDRPDAIRAIMSWNEVEIPPVQQRRAVGTWLLEPVRFQAVIDYRSFASDAIADSIAHVVRVVKDASSGRKLCGAAYGHVLAGAPHGIPTPVGGHLSLKSVLDLPQLDFLVANANGGISGVSALPAASAARAGVAVLPDTADQVEDWLGTTAAGIGRGPLLALPSQPDGADVAELVQRFDTPMDAEIAAIVDDDNVALLAADSPMTDLVLAEQMRQLMRVGAPVDLWLLDDFLNGRVPHYRMYVFLNAFQVQIPVFRQALQSSVQRGDLVLWQCAPGLLATNFSGRRIKQLTGITTSVSLARGPLTAQLTPGNAAVELQSEQSIVYGCDRPVSPRPQILDRQVQVLGTDEEGSPSLVLRDTPSGTTVYSIAPAVPARVLQGLARRANVHLYTDRPCRVHANDRLVAIKSADTGQITVRLPQVKDVVRLGANEQIATGSDGFRLSVTAGNWQVLALD